MYEKILSIFFPADKTENAPKHACHVANVLHEKLRSYGCGITYDPANKKKNLILVSIPAKYYYDSDVMDIFERYQKEMEAMGYPVIKAPVALFSML